MTLEQLIGLSVALLVMCLGLLGSVLPGLPSTPLILLAAIGHRLYFGQSSASNTVFAGLVLITLLSLGLDYIASVAGAKRMGATWRGVLGAILGAMIGVFFSLPGVILGPFLGALAFEMISGREFTESARAGVGAMLGLLVGAVGKLGCCVAMMGLFAISVIARSGTVTHLSAQAVRLWTG